MMINGPARAHLILVTAIGRRLDGAVCAGSLANAARSVHQDTIRAGQRREAQAAVEQMEQIDAAQQAAPRVLGVRRTG